MSSAIFGRYSETVEAGYLQFAELLSRHNILCLFVELNYCGFNHTINGVTDLSDCSNLELFS
jgi:hypothetical protein